MATIKKEEKKHEVDKLEKSRQIVTDLSYNLQELSERVKSCISSVDTSDVDDVNHCNGIINMLNELIKTTSQNQKVEYTLFELIKLTDEDGNPVTEYKNFVVGYLFIENSKETYYKCRIVKARTPKEAIYIYQKNIDLIDDSVDCFGEYEDTGAYASFIEDKTVLEMTV